MKESKNKKPQSANGEIKPGEIQGKIEVTDKRERRDGPGGN